MLSYAQGLMNQQFKLINITHIASLLYLAPCHWYLHEGNTSQYLLLQSWCGVQFVNYSCLIQI